MATIITSVEIFATFFRIQRDGILGTNNSNWYITDRYILCRYDYSGTW